ncbi:NADPH-dependent 7-cyano-7-deazaguanine reductase QueF [Flocculibacter collagenilyticus]|uniref:NADPH-dependent 7-cyano-7-deazaguanine reductase QueF n=1 Tax=Flocculibacter collagenilyticus TaxID=2744479 RepID=UPI0018F3B786|nr:NADPH-dependent 7-cyano-7-deazaguanine reductase QueF [Flocculibacter collagenilyticus]
MTDQHYQSNLQNIALGKTTEYKSNYDPTLLYPVPRKLNRDQLAAQYLSNMQGTDIWHGYELSWLNVKGKPQVALATFSYSAATANIVESKSFKLYLNSFNQSRFNSADEVKGILEKDLSALVEGAVTVAIHQPDDISTFKLNVLPGKCIDELDIEIDQYDLQPDYLADATTSAITSNNSVITETVHSHLLKSNCLITSQPDWGSVVIEYTGAAINHESLLKYLISFRMHNEFHEQCVERIYADIMQHCKPEKLSVYARYTRRGGLDINPFRSNVHLTPPWAVRTNRQ